MSLVTPVFDLSISVYEITPSTSPSFRVQNSDDLHSLYDISSQ